MSVEILGLILDISVTDSEFIHSVVHFYARGDHLRWAQPPTPGARFLPEDPYLHSLWVESYMNTCGLDKHQAILGYAFDAILAELQRTKVKSGFGLNWWWINYLPKSPYFYLSLVPLAAPAFDYNGIPLKRKCPHDEAITQQAEAEHRTLVTTQRIPTTTPVAHSFVRMDPSVARSDPFVSNPAPSSRESDTQMALGPNGKRPWLRRISKVSLGPRILRRKSRPNSTPSPSSGDETWSMVSESPVRRYVPRYGACSRVNPSKTTMDNGSQTPPMSSAVDTSVAATEYENQESAPVIDDFQLSQSADLIISVASSDSPLIAPNMQPGFLEDQPNLIESNPWSLFPAMLDHGLQVGFSDGSSSMLYPANENTALDDFQLPDPLPDLSTEEPQSLQDLLATDMEVCPNDYDPRYGFQQDIPFGHDFILFEAE
ncbi:hypothetical protein ASPCADRAFT_130727 [Aspergillus carbonarius ITEM 5010]|uniref:Uncharacterized protein n=1 Tax=Aspergillus carbonarius (strain ITEM 5010) TaxID=602072 RepID=A0A1R3RL90_ASPC5|nr:hypothetical protein ASPCADRAFT_130727 [Aspergillus carbonarius ITEM 5010]